MSALPPAPSHGRESVCAVVVTHNRRDLLARSLGALRDQERPVDAILVVDNASTDGTDAMLAERFGDVERLRLEHNEGGAGGFHAGIRAAFAGGWDWLWLMDDDTLPGSAALARLLDAGAQARRLRPASILASRVIWRDGRVHPMNSPGLRSPYVGELLALCEAGLTDRRLVPIRNASFVSVLVHRDAVARHGLPYRQFRLWNDDLEYTGRILRDEDGYLVLDSVVEHLTGTPYSPWQVKGERFYFEVRNKLFVVRSGSFSRAEKLHLLRELQHEVRRFARHNDFRPAELASVVRGAWDGVRRRLPPPDAA